MNTQLAKTIKHKFQDAFNSNPLMFFSPGRINIIGEHTDYNEGYVFPAAVNKGIYAAISKSETDESTVTASDFNETIQFSVANIAPLPKESWGNYILGVVSEIQKKNKKIPNFNMVFGGDIPSGSGMSSSAALENSVVFGLNTLFDLNLTKTDMILISQKAEHNYVGVNCGIMDQYASMFGIKNHALRLDCRTMQALPFKIDFKAYELILINTNVKHSLSDSAYNDRRAVCEKVSKMLNIKALRDASVLDLQSIKNRVSDEDYQKALYVIQENKRVLDASQAMLNDDLRTLGTLLYESHYGLQHQYKASCEELDFLVAQAKLNTNILGARMMGGGFGGCTINLIAKAGVQAFKTFITEAYQTQFNKDCSIYAVALSDGTHILN